MDYTTFPYRTVNIGLDLRDSVDKVDEGNWVRLNNIRSTQEGQIQGREGFDLFISTGVVELVHSLRRMDDATLLVGAGPQVFRNGTPFPTAGYSGNPLGIVPYRPLVSSSPWAYVADTNQMRKLRSDGLDYKWGVTRPTGTLTFATAGAGNLDSSVPGGTVYDWRATYQSSVTGAESNPTSVANGIAAVSQQVTISVVASADPQVDTIILYRRGGTLLDWTLSFTTPNVSGNVIDNNSDSAIAANEILSLDRDVPFTSIDADGNTVLETNMPYAWGPFQGKYIMACGATYQPGSVFWTNPNKADEASSANNVEVTAPNEPLQNGLIYASLPFVASRDDWYGLDYGSSTDTTFQPRKMPVGKGLAAPWAFCVGPMVWFLGDDGIYQTNFSSPAESITEEHLRPLFRGTAVSNFLPIDYSRPTRLKMAYFANEVWFFYTDTDNAGRILIYNTLYKRWRSGQTTTSSPFTGYTDENSPTAKLYTGAGNGNVYLLNYQGDTDDGLSFTSNARTGSTDQGTGTTLKEYGNILVDCDPEGGSIVVTPYINAEQTALPSITLTGNGRQKFTRSLGDVRAFNIGFDFAFTGSQGILYQFEMLWRMEEEPLRHWQFITTHGQSGWQHVRDAYIALVSNSTVNLTVNVDGVDFGPYAIPSTGGIRAKQHVQLLPTKGKIFTYTLDSEEDFRLFGNECELRVKSWNTALGYQLISPFQDQKVEA